MARTTRYSTVSIVLRWLIAALLLDLVASGLLMVKALQDPALRFAAFQTYQAHKAAGLTVLAQSVLRLAWRLLHPPLPEGAGRLSPRAWRHHAASPFPPWLEHNPLIQAHTAGLTR